jgi:hypothetical protein
MSRSFNADALLHSLSVNRKYKKASNSGRSSIPLPQWGQNICHILILRSALMNKKDLYRDVPVEVLLANHS